MKSMTDRLVALWLAALLLVMATTVTACGSEESGNLPARTTSGLPARPDPPRLVNDLADVLGDTDAMEDTLEALARDTGNQIVVVTVTDLLGLDPWDYALQLGREWGVGQKDKNNGVVVLIKPKTSRSKGRAYIAVGYGLEGAIPDAVATRIVNSEMIPHFKRDDYRGGAQAAIDVLVPLARGEYGPDAYTGRLSAEEDDDDVILAVAIFIMIFGFVMVFGGAAMISDDDDFRSGGGSATWGGPIIFGGGGRSSSSSSWSGGSSSWGGGGFGGFGGGSFGGGGGGGSW